MSLMVKLKDKDPVKMKDRFLKLCFHLFHDFAFISKLDQTCFWVISLNQNSHLFQIVAS